ncbi:DUF6691 family protein [Thiomicrorhabdus arctica]|jgi:hypothetical protein|uniref:DUF6691 family protein n=1 Tax=Thiomicrorhabdus arctica TaxID=131540 RepID=UPI00035DD969|nr:DUF6691 family protein [Thiomicrorhabdus arctica]
MPTPEIDLNHKTEENSPNLSRLQKMKFTIQHYYYSYRTNISGILLGALFGFLMSHAGATTYDYHAKMFLLIDLQLVKVIGTSIVVAIIGISLLKKYKVRAISTGVEVDFVKKKYQEGLITGAFLFGVGWAMTASCPGTVPAMLGEGKVGAIFTLIGLLLGTMAYGVLQTYNAHNKTLERTHHNQD